MKDPSPSLVKAALDLISCSYFPAFRKNIIPLLMTLMSPNLGIFFAPDSSFEPLCPLALIRMSSSVRMSTFSLVYSRSVATISRSSTLDLTIPRSKRILKARSMPLLVEVLYVMIETRKSRASLRLESIMKLSLSVL